ncbi:hypothetical protein D915_002743 [Fasciola hepatica]|uniref:Uncharacterized protein n=1 Tax=Fasciola hepatica TaxID=6192 RepID=A0A2H1CNA1_FASHE|nr:hypothetical protein D915_002743 [Fasciola hepatica]
MTRLAASGPQSSTFHWPWISVLIGSVLFLICLIGVVVLLTGSSLSLPENVRSSPKSPKTIVSTWPTFVTNNRKIRFLKQKEHFLTNSHFPITDHERSRASRTTLTTEQSSNGKANLESLVFKTLNYAPDGSNSAEIVQHRDISKQNVVHETPPPTVSIPEKTFTMEITNPASPGTSEQLDPVNSHLNRAILRYFKSVLTRMTDHNERSRREKALKFLVRYNRQVRATPEYQHLREDSHISLATILRQSILIDIFNELDYNGDGSISLTELDLFLRFHEILP